MFNAYGIYYGDGFEDCLKQVRDAHPNLDLSQITTNNIVLPMPRGEDTVNKETVDSVHTVEQEVETDDMVIAQPAPTVDVLPVVNPTIPNAPPS